MPENTHFASVCSSNGPLLDIKYFENKEGAAGVSDGVMIWAVADGGVVAI